MEESKTPPSSSQSLGESSSSMETGDDKSPAGTNDASSRSNMNQNNKTLPTKTSGEDEAKRKDEEGETYKDGTEARVETGSKENINANSTGERDEKATKLSIPEQDVLPVDEGAVKKLTEGFLQTFLPQAEHSNTILDELMRNQRVLIETLQQENAKFKENQMMAELSELMTEAKKYHSKLVHLRKEMMSLHEKSTKLKKRALKLQHHKMKQNLQKEQQREREMEQEKHLIAKPATKKTP